MPPVFIPKTNFWWLADAYERGGCALVKAVTHCLCKLMIILSIHTPILLVVHEYILSDGHPYFALVARRRRLIDSWIMGLL